MIVSVENPAQVLEALAETKASAGKGWSNLIVNTDKIASWVGDKRLQLSRNGENYLLLLEEPGFNRVFFMSPSLKDLESLPKGELPDSGVLVSDVLGTKQQVEQVSECLTRLGFKPHARLLRMARVQNETQFLDEPCDHVVEATIADVDVVQRMLSYGFDVYAEAAPTRDELVVAVGNGELLLSLEDERISGVLMHSTKGMSTELRFWYVEPEFRGQGVGQQLYDQYVRSCSTCRRFVLWVMESNDRVKRAYRHYGYKEDGLVDQVFIRSNDV